ncbi:MAG: glycosyltransferase 87 family protein, partial [Anaerolineales bacterium]
MWLALLGALFLGISVIGLLLPYNLFSLRLAPLRNIANLTNGDRRAQASFVLTLASLAGIYYLAWRACRAAGIAAAAAQRQPRAMWVALLGSLLVVNLAMLWLYPIDAADVFDNIDRGRITAIHGGNPFYDAPRQFVQDVYFQYVAWPDYTSAYGPLWELLSAATVRVVGDQPSLSGRLTMVLAFKGLGLGFYAGCLALIAAILRRRAPERTLQGVCLFGLNPFVIYETAGNAHNDIVMVFFILLGLWAVLRGQYIWAALALLAGALIKFIPLLLLPMAVAAALRALPNWRRRLRYGLVTGLAGAALVVAVFAPFWRGGDILAIQRRGTLFTASLPALAQAQLEAGLG